MEYLSKIFGVLSNKYVISIMIFVVYVGFFDDNNFIAQSKLSKELKELKAEKVYYLNEIKTNTEVQNLLMSDIEHLEEFAREEYRMKKDDEDVFVFEYEKKED